LGWFAKLILKDFKVSFLYVLENKKDAGVIHQHQKV
jgi:hypothetical protein